MILKNKIIDIEKTTQYNREMYIVFTYNMLTKEFVFGGRVHSMDFILETIQALFELETEFIEDPKFNQRMNIRWKVKNLDFDHYNKCVTVLRGNYFYKYDKLQQLKRQM